MRAVSPSQSPARRCNIGGLIAANNRPDHQRLAQPLSPRKSTAGGRRRVGPCGGRDPWQAKLGPAETDEATHGCVKCAFSSCHCAAPPLRRERDETHQFFFEKQQQHRLCERARQSSCVTGPSANELDVSAELAHWSHTRARKRVWREPIHDRSRLRWCRRSQPRRALL